MIILNITHLAGDNYNFSFSMTTGGVMSGFPGTIAKSTVDTITLPYHKAASTNGVSITDFKIAGVMIHSQLPHDVQLYLESHPTEPLLIQTNDSAVPWELYHDEFNYQVLSRPIGRIMIMPVMVQPKGKMISSQSKPSVLIIANPGRDNPKLDLPSADEEGAALCTFFQQAGCNVNMLAGKQANRFTVMGHLQGTYGTYDIIHYAGHAALENSGGKLFSSLVLADGPLSSEEIRRSFRGSPLVFLNACHTIAPGHSGSGTDFSIYAMGSQNALDLAKAFSLGNPYGSVRALVGTLFRNNDTRSREMALFFYQQLMEGESIGESLRASRQKIFSPTDITWASYILYGDPRIRLRGDDAEESNKDNEVGTAENGKLEEPVLVGTGSTIPPGEEEEENPPPIDAEMLGNSGIQAIFNALQETGGSTCKMLTTPHLFLGMATVEGGYTYAFLRQQVKDPELIIKLFREVTEMLSESLEGSGVSDRITNILQSAHEYAKLDNQETVHIEEKHLLQGFFEDGGGMTSELLSKVGVDLPEADRSTILAMALFKKHKTPEPPPLKYLGLSGKMVVDVAYREARSHGHSAMTTPHLLIGVLQVDRKGMRSAIRTLGINPNQLEQILRGLLVPGRLPPGANIGVGQRFIRILEIAKTLADPIEARQIGMAILKEGQKDPESITIKVLQHCGISPSNLLEAVSCAGKDHHSYSEQNESQSAPAQSILAAIGKDLTQLARDGRLAKVIGRNDEIDSISEILLRKAKACPVLVGEAGVGKTAIVEGFAQRVAEGKVPPALQNIRVIEIATNDILAGTKYRGEFEERMRNLVQEVTKAGNIILFLDEIHTLIGAGGSRDGAMDAGDILKPALARGDIKCIGATTNDEYRRWIENDTALERRFSPVPIPEPSADEAVQILTGIRLSYEAHHGVTIPAATIESAVHLSCERLPHRRLPDKAIDLLDQACARVQRLRNQDSGEEESIVPEVGVHHLEEVISVLTGVPVPGGSGIPGDTGGAKLQVLSDALHKRILGQDMAITTLIDAIGLAESRMREAGRPLSVLMFMGMVGVGKSSLAKAFAEETGRTLIQLDMSEYSERHQVAKLIGSPAGYIGYGREGYLTGKLRSHPYSVVLLDEMEKAHPEVSRLFLGLFEEGRLTDAKGRTIEARQTIFIMTSNLGGDAKKGCGNIGFTAAAGGGSDSDPREMLKQAFSREFIDRIDRIVQFGSLNRPDVEAIVRMLLDDIWARLAEQHGMAVDEDAAVIGLLCNLGYAPDSGVRPLKRALEEHVISPISKLYLDGMMTGKAKLGVKVQAGRMVFAVE